jgi:mono/diheme cytochrome c family protein
MNKIVFGFFLLFFVACSEGELTDMHRLSNGAKLYKMNCANCHQEKGEGLARLMPPIMLSDWLLANMKELPCLIKNGSKQPMLVNGVLYKQAMPSLSHLSDSEVKDICVFVVQKFGDITLEQADTMFSDSLNSCN